MRAKLKSMEELPELAKCCTLAAASMERYRDIVFELVGEPFSVTGSCFACGFRGAGPFMLYKVVPLDGINVIPVSFIDIDEG
jgi:hypothetical protein